MTSRIGAIARLAATFAGSFLLATLAFRWALLDSELAEELPYFLSGFLAAAFLSLVGYFGYLAGQTVAKVYRGRRLDRRLANLAASKRTFHATYDHQTKTGHVIRG